MKEKTIYDFQLRGNYRNYNLLTFFLNQRAIPEHKLHLKGYIPSVVEYKESKTGESKEITVNFEETHYLCQQNVENARGFLRNIIEAREGSQEAQKFLDKKADKYYKEKHRYCDNLLFTENDYIVPSTSKRKYDENHISQKGAMLLSLVQEGYPVPDFCILTAKSYQLSTEERKPVINEAISNLEKLTSQKLGSYSLRWSLPYDALCLFKFRA